MYVHKHFEKIFSSLKFKHVIETFMNTFHENWNFYTKWEYLFSSRRNWQMLFRNSEKFIWNQVSLKFLIYNKLLHGNISFDSTVLH